MKPSLPETRTSQPRSVREEYKVLTRQKLVQAAMEEFERVGYAACTVEEVARRAGTSRATFYTHFSGKVELVEGMWDSIRLRLIGLYRELARTPVRDREMLKGWLTRSFAYYADNRAHLLAINEAIVLEPELADVYMERIEQVIDLVAPLIADHLGVTPSVARFRAALLTMQHDRFCFFWILRGMHFDAEEALEGVTDQWYDLIGTSSA